MNATNAIRSIIILFIPLAVIFCLPSSAVAHCDTMNGPVVKAAEKALETGNVNLVLIWVRKADEAAIRDAFARTMAVRSLGAEAKALADLSFFETLVRLHRAGEGVPYTGLKPAGAAVEPGIEAADEAIEAGTVDELVKHLTTEVETGVRAHFARLVATTKFAGDDLEGGRAHVAAYVTFIHHVEGLVRAAKSADGHLHESGTSHDQ